MSNSKGTAKGDTIANLDKVKLEKAIIDGGYTIGGMSQIIGYNGSYLGKVLHEQADKKNNLNLSNKAFKSICLILKKDGKEFLLPEPKKEEPKKVAPIKETKEVPNITVQSGITAEQFNVLLGVLSSINDSLTKIAETQNAKTVISGQIYGDVHSICDSLGVKTPMGKTIQPKSPSGGYVKPITIK